MLKKIVNRIADHLGYVVLKKKDSPNLESHLSLVIEKYAIDLVVDVGANEGQFAKDLRKLGYCGAILSFEPVKAAFEKLQVAAETDPAWQIFNLALGHQKEKLTINTFDVSKLSSILGPSEFGIEKFPFMEAGRSEVIDADTLDNVLAEMAVTGRRILLKMDTQGYDLNVFRGAAKSLRDVRILLSEIAFQPIYEGMPLFDEVLKEFGRSGFRVSGLYPISRNKKTTIVEMDCVLLSETM